jgi:sugar lactone lactonase YvrE
LQPSSSSPGGIGVDANGNLYIADTNNRVCAIGADGKIKTIAGTCAADFDGDAGLALSAVWNGPNGPVADAAGNIWIADTGNTKNFLLWRRSPPSKSGRSPSLMQSVCSQAPSRREKSSPSSG